MFKKRAKAISKDTGPSEPFLIWASGLAYHIASSINRDTRGELWCSKGEAIEDKEEPRWVTSQPDYGTGGEYVYEEEIRRIREGKTPASNMRSSIERTRRHIGKPS